MRSWRKVYASLLDSEQVAQLSEAALNLLLFLIIAQDDTGFYPWTPAKLRSLTANRPKWKQKHVKTFANELVSVGIAIWIDGGLQLIKGEHFNGLPRRDIAPLLYQRASEAKTSEPRVRDVDVTLMPRVRDVDVTLTPRDEGVAQSRVEKSRVEKSREEERRGGTAAAISKSTISPNGEPPKPSGGGAGNHDADFYGELPKRSNIMVLYEAEIGLLSPLIAEELEEAEKLYPAEWVYDAFREAVELNKRSWRYIERILQRWAREGKDNGWTPEGNHAKRERDSGGHQGPTPGKYDHLNTRIDMDA